MEPLNHAICVSEPDNPTSTQTQRLLDNTQTTQTSVQKGRQLQQKDYVIGISLLLIVVVLWTSSNFITQELFEDGYEKPFFVTYLNTSSFALYLLPFLARRRFKNLWCRDGNRSMRHEYQSLSSEVDMGEDAAGQVMASTQDTSESIHINRLPPLTDQETAKLASIFCFFWFIANWSVNASLDFTSVASATILSSTSGFFTLAVGRIFHVETLTPTKVGAVVVSFIGVVLVSLSDSSQTRQALVSTSLGKSDHQEQPFLGDALALLSAIFYALYVTLLKYRIKSESRIDMQLFFGFVGLFNILACWPIAFILHFSGAEHFELPRTGKVIGAILINMAITLSSDYLYVLAMLKTTPLVVTIGISLTIPLAIIGDFYLKKPTKGQAILGAFLVLVGFVAVGMAHPREEGRGVEGGNRLNHGVDTVSQEEVELGDTEIR